MQRTAYTLIVLSVVFSGLLAPTLADSPSPGIASQMHISTSSETPDYFNPDGSCVLLSLGMCGRNSGNMNAATLPFDTCYGPAERGGAWPSRVSNIFNTRGIKGWNVTGSTTPAWIDWAIRTGRFAAIGAGQAHFQTAWGYDPVKRHYLVCNNQTPKRIDRYTREQFLRLHYESGPWCVVLQRPTSEAPEPVEWWKE